MPRKALRRTAWQNRLALRSRTGNVFDKDAMKSFKTVFLIPLVLLLAGCAGLFGPRDVVLPIDRLQAALDRRFPLDQRFLELFDVRITHPQLRLQPDTNRVETSLDAQIAPTLFGQPWNGSITLSGELKIDAGRNAVVLAAPRVERFLIDGIDPRFADRLGRFGAVLVENMLKDVPLYTFRPEDLRYGGTNFIAQTIRTRADALVVSFVPAK